MLMLIIYRRCFMMDTRHQGEGALKVKTPASLVGVVFVM